MAYIGNGIQSRSELDAGVRIAPAMSRRAAIARRDIRRHIAATPQNDPNNFDPVEYQRYPLMPVDKSGAHIKDEIGKEIVFYNEDEENAFYDEHPEHAEYRHRDPEDVQDELTRLREENARLKVDRGETDDKTDKADAKGGVAGLVNAAGAGKQPAGPKTGSKL